MKVPVMVRRLRARYGGPQERTVLLLGAGLLGSTSSKDSSDAAGKAVNWVKGLTGVNGMDCAGGDVSAMTD
jgi:hypothetical protein